MVNGKHAAPWKTAGPMMRITVTKEDAKRGYKIIRVVISGYWNSKNEDAKPGNKSVTKS